MINLPFLTCIFYPKSEDEEEFTFNTIIHEMHQLFTKNKIITYMHIIKDAFILPSHTSLHVLLNEKNNDSFYTMYCKDIDTYVVPCFYEEYDVARFMKSFNLKNVKTSIILYENVHNIVGKSTNYSLLIIH